MPLIPYFVFAATCAGLLAAVDQLDLSELGVGTNVLKAVFAGAGIIGILLMVGEIKSNMGVEPRMRAARRRKASARRRRANRSRRQVVSNPAERKRIDYPGYDRDGLPR